MILTVTEKSYEMKCYKFKFEHLKNLKKCESNVMLSKIKYLSILSKIIQKD